MKKILVIGGGSFGTCLSNLLIENGHDAYLWEYDEKVRSVIRETNENPIFLPGIKLSEKLNVIDDYATEIEKVKLHVELSKLFISIFMLSEILRVSNDF